MESKAKKAKEPNNKAIMYAITKETNESKAKKVKEPKNKAIM